MRLDWPNPLSVWIALASCVLMESVACRVPAHAESSEPAAEIDLFLDLDRDGAMSYEEFVQSLSTRSMKALDRDRDGFLSETEVKAQTPTMQNFVPLRFSEIDTNGDQRASGKEVEAATRKSPRVRMLYDTLDADRDDRVTPAEWRRRPPGLGLLKIEF